MKDTLQTYSVLGDSISTFRGVTPAAGVYYGPESGGYSGVRTAEDTWWMTVITQRGGQLLANDSRAGSTVSGEGPTPAVTPRRIRNLSRNGVSPDVILVFAGLNDWDLYIDPAHFASEYRRMLQRIRQIHPHTLICCGTFPGAHFIHTPGVPATGAWRRELYNDGIRSAAREPGCRLADLAALERTYESMDGAHPTGRGMKQLAAMWLACLG